MIWLIKCFILIIMSANPRSKIVRDETYRTEIAEHIVDASEIYNHNPFWLAYNIKRESDFRSGIISKSNLKEYGMCQVHGVARRMCKNDFGFNLKSDSGQIYCMAALLEYGRDLCGNSNISAMYWYLSGKCKPSKKVKIKYNRMTRAFDKYMNKLVDSGYEKEFLR